MGKLVRDKIPEIMRAQGKIVQERIMNEEEFLKRLKEKLLEEAQEVYDANSLVELTEELADVLEVVHVLARSYGISMSHVEEKRLEKLESRGSFDARIYSNLSPKKTLAFQDAT